MISAMIGNIDDVDSFMESDLTKVSTSELTGPHEYNILSEDCHGHDGDDDSCGGNDDDDDDDDDNHFYHLSPKENTWKGHLLLLTLVREP